MSYRSEYHEQVDSLFNQLKRNPFTGPISDPTAYERDIPLEPAAWVTNSQATVIIDDEGIKITDGAIFLEDYSGSSVLGPSGFDGSWIDFIESGFFNGNFNGGALSSEADPSSWFTAETIVGTAHTRDDYEASLSTAVPFYVFSDITGSGRYGIVEDSTFGRGLRVSKNAAASSVIEFFQDIPARGGQHVELGFWFVMDPTEAVTNTVQIYLSELDSDHAVVSGGDDDSLWETETNTTANTYERIPLMETVSPLDTVRYLRVKIKVTLGATVSSHTSNVTFYGFRAKPRLQVDSIWFPYQSSTDLTTTLADIIKIGTVGLEMQFLDPLRGLHINMLSSALGGGADDTALRITRGGVGSETLYITADGDINTEGDVNVAGNISTESSVSVGVSGASSAFGLSRFGYIAWNTEISDPNAPPANTARLYIRDNGAGKTELVIRFSSGAVQVIATQP